MNGHSQITVELPQSELDFARQYADEHGMNLSKLFDTLIINLSQDPLRHINPKLRSMMGILPPDTDIDALRMAYLTEKYLKDDRND